MIQSVPTTGGPTQQVEGAKLTKNDEMGRDEFTRLLIAQLKNQDPFQPLTSTEFMNQLTQMSNLEQLIAVKTKLEGLDSLKKSLFESQALSHLGKEVVVSSSEIRISSGEVENMEYELGVPAENVTVSIFDSTGRTVFTKSEGDKTPGVYQVGWNGRDSNGHRLGDGTYLVQVTWSNGQDSPTPVPTQLRGVVEAVTHNALGEPLLKVGSRNVSLASVRQIGEPSTGQ